MDIDQRLRQAAKEAILELEIENTTVNDVISHTMSYDFHPETFSIHFRESDGKYFRVVVDTIDVHQRYGADTIEILKSEIIKKLQERNPNDYLS